MVPSFSHLPSGSTGVEMNSIMVEGPSTALTIRLKALDL